MGLLDSGGGIYLSVDNTQKLVRPLALDTVTVRTRSVPSVTQGDKTIRSFRAVTIDGFYNQHYLDKNQDPLWEYLNQKDKYNKDGKRSDFPFRMIQLLPVWSYVDRDVRVVKQGNQLFEAMTAYLKSIMHLSPEERMNKGLHTCDWAVWKEGSGDFSTKYKSTRQDSSQFTAASFEQLQPKIQAMMAQAISDLDPFKGDEKKLVTYIYGNQGQTQQALPAGQPQFQQNTLPQQVSAPPGLPPQGGFTPGGTPSIGFGQQLPGFIPPLSQPAPVAPTQFTPPPVNAGPYQFPVTAPSQQFQQALPTLTTPTQVVQPVSTPNLSVQVPPAVNVGNPQPQLQPTGVGGGFPSFQNLMQQPTAPSQVSQPPQPGSWGQLQGFGGTPNVESTIARQAQQMSQQPQQSLAPVNVQPVFAPPPTQPLVQTQMQQPVPQVSVGVQDPGKTVVTGGKYNGQTLEYIYSVESPYLNFLRGNKKDLRPAIDAFLSTVQQNGQPVQIPASPASQTPAATEQQSVDQNDRNLWLREINQLMFNIPEFQGDKIENMIKFLQQTVGDTNFAKMNLDQLKNLHQALMQYKASQAVAGA